MALLRNKWATLSLLVVIWAVIASFMAAYYYLQYSDFSNRVSGVLIYVNIGVDYGNGTRVFSNDTKTVTGATLLDVTAQAFNLTCKLNYSGTKVTSIEGVNEAAPYGWTYWIWNSTGNSWSIVFESADNYKVSSNETVVWYYTNGFNPPT